MQLLEILRPDADDEAQKREADAGQQQEGDHGHRVRNRQINKEMRRDENHRTDEQRLGGCSPHIANDNLEEADRGREQLVDRAHEFGEIDAERGVGRGLCHHAEHNQTGHDERAVADPLHTVDARPDGGAEDHKIERGRDHRRDKALHQCAEKPRHFEYVNGPYSFQIHFASSTRPTKISSSEDCRVDTSRVTNPALATSPSKVVIPVRSAAVS